MELIEINAYPVKNVLRKLLQDKTTGKNIIFATDDYIRYGWIVKKMNDHCDIVWRVDKYADDWQKYVSLRILEITCGEAPLLVTRYDTTTGEPLLISERTGILDRKLQAIQTDDEETWIKWAYKAYESTYGYEFQ